MKNLIVSLVVVLVAGITPALAHDPGHDPRVEKAFVSQFTGAENVTWTQLEDGYHRVIFNLNGVRVEAFYDENAELLGTARNLLYTQLPLLVMQTVNNKFTDAAVLEVQEITNSEGTQYKIVLEQKDKKRLSLRLSSSGSILDKQKIKK